VNVIRTPLNDVLIVEPVQRTDMRGFFMESYHKKKFADLGIQVEFVQDNHSLSVHPGTLRGLHFQEAPMAQSKLVRVVAGAIFDVAVDIRPGSPQFGRWYGVELSAANCRQLFVPQGFAHGFMTLEPNSEVVYKVDQYYSPQHDHGVRWDDPDIAVRWPLQSPLLSDKDAVLPLLRELFP
jgi:dTDP-4-dehydrorhamnose 3,5-epimerase